MRNVSDKSFNTPAQIEQRLVLLEDQIRILNLTLKAFFVQGRLRTDRTIPANSAAVAAGDQLYDIIQTPTYQYTLVNNSGTLNWVRATNSTF